MSRVLDANVNGSNGKNAFTVLNAYNVGLIGMKISKPGENTRRTYTRFLTLLQSHRGKKPSEITFYKYVYTIFVRS